MSKVMLKDLLYTCTAEKVGFDNIENHELDP